MFTRALLSNTTSTPQDPASAGSEKDSDPNIDHSDPIRPTDRPQMSLLREVFFFRQRHRRRPTTHPSRDRSGTGPSPHNRRPLPHPEPRPAELVRRILQLDGRHAHPRRRPSGRHVRAQAHVHGGLHLVLGMVDPVRGELLFQQHLLHRRGGHLGDGSRRSDAQRVILTGHEWNKVHSTRRVHSTILHKLDHPW